MRIRTAIPRDYAICASIYESAWNLALPGAQRSIGVRELENETADELTLVGVIDETVCGYISIWEPDWFIHHLYVDPATQEVVLASICWNTQRAWPSPIR